MNTVNDTSIMKGEMYPEGVTANILDTLTTLADNSSEFIEEADYDYDADYVHDASCMRMTFYLRGVVGCIVIVIGLIGNVASLGILLSMGYTSVIFLLLKALAVADSVYLVSYLLTATLPELIRKGQTAYYKSGIYIIIRFVFPIASIASTCTGMLTMLVTIHRYIFVCRAMKSCRYSSSKWVKAQIAAVVIFSIIIDIPRFFETELEDITFDGRTITVLALSDLWTNKSYQLIYRAIFITIVRRVIPIGIVIVLTVKLIRSLVQRNRYRMRTFTSQRRPQEYQQIITVVLVVLATVYVCCQLPASIYPLIRAATGIRFNCENYLAFTFACLADLLNNINSASNFFIYYPFIPMFREKFLSLFHYPRGKNDHGTSGRHSDDRMLTSPTPALTPAMRRMEPRSDVINHNPKIFKEEDIKLLHVAPSENMIDQK